MDSSRNVALDGAIITPNFAYGYATTSGGNNIWHLEGHKVIYPVGQYFATLEPSDQAVTFIPTHERVRAVRAMCLASTRKYAACIEEVFGEESQQVSIYNLHTEKQMRTFALESTCTKATKAVCVSFSCDSKLLLVQCGAPDWTVLVWRWYSAKVTVAMSLGVTDITRCEFNPWDDTVVAACSNSSARLLRLDLHANSGRVNHVADTDPSAGQPAFLCLLWLVGGLLALGTSSGDILICHDGALRARLSTSHASRIPGPAAPSVQNGVAADGIHALATKGRGFVAAGSRGEVYFFEPPDRAVGRGSSTDMYHLARTVSFNMPGVHVMGLSVSSTDDHIALTTACRRLLMLDLNSLPLEQQQALPAAQTDNAQQSDEQELEDQEYGAFSSMCHSFHSSRIVGLDAIMQQPLLVAVGADRSVRVWDYVRRTCIVAKQLVDEPLCCSLHPSGFLLLLGTHEKLQLMYILKNDLLSLCDLPAVRKATLARFAHGGHIFAAVGRTNAVHIYATHACGATGPGSAAPPALAQLKAHVSTVTDIAFSGDDKQLISVGAGGACYFWDLTTFTRLMDIQYVDKQCVYYAACYSDRHHAAVVRTLDGRLQHLREGRCEYETSGLGQDFAPMALVGDGRVLLAATGRGSVITMGWPRSMDAGCSSGSASATASSAGIGSGDTAAAGAESTSGIAHSGPSHTTGGAAGQGSSSSGILQQGARAGQASTAGNVQSCGGAAVSSQGGAGAASGAHAPEGLQEFRLHTGRIVAMVALPARGLLFTASVDGVLMVSHVNLVLDGILSEQPLPARPLRSSMPGTTATEAPTKLTATLQSNTAPAAPAISSAPVSAPLPTAGPAVRLVADSYISALKERAMDATQQLQLTQFSAEVAAKQQSQVLRDRVSELEAALAEEKARADGKAAELEEFLSRAAAREQQIVHELEGLHSAAADELEALYEARLALEAERVRQLAAARDDAELAGKEQLQRLRAVHAQELDGVFAQHRVLMDEEQEHLAAAEVLRHEQEVVMQEALQQTEADLEQHADRVNEQMLKIRKDATDLEAKFKAENNILKRANQRLIAEKADDAARVAALTAEARSLKDQVSDEQLTVVKLKREVEERDALIADNYNTLQGLRRRCQELEKHKFVLSYKADSYHSQLGPAEAQHKKLQQSLRAQDNELVRSHTALKLAEKSVQEKEAFIQGLKTELWEAKRGNVHRQALLDAVGHDIFHVLQTPDERAPGDLNGLTMRTRALEQLVSKYSVKGAAAIKTSVQVEAELTRHIQMVELKGATLELKLAQEKKQARQEARSLQHQNTQLLGELAELQRAHKLLARQLAALGAEVSQFGSLSSTVSRSMVFGGTKRDAGHPSSSGGPVARDGSPVLRGAGSLAGRAVPSRPNSMGSPRRATAGLGATRPQDAAHLQSFQPTTNPVAGNYGTDSSRPTSAAAGPGSPAGGKLVSAAAGRAIAEMIGVERQRIEALEAALGHSASLVAAQAEQIGRLRGVITQQLHVDLPGEDWEGQEGPGSADGTGQSAGGMEKHGSGSRRGSGSRSCSPTTFTRTEAHSRPHSAAAGLAHEAAALQRPSTAKSPSGDGVSPGSSAKRRPASAASFSMHAQIKSSVESWRAP